MWSADGKWLYFLSDRALNTTVGSPWGSRQPDPHFDHQQKIYEVALVPGLRSPFLPADELHPDTPEKEEKKEEPKKDADAKGGQDKGTGTANKDSDKEEPRPRKESARRSRSTSPALRIG